MKISKDEKEKRSRRGRTSKAKGATFERVISKKFAEVYGEELVRTPQSGGFVKHNAKASEFRGDVVPADEGVNLLLHLECKNTKTWSLPAWIKQASEDCPKGKKPCVIFHQHNSAKDFICLSLTDFFSLVPKGRIIRKRVKIKRK